MSDELSLITDDHTGWTQLTQATAHQLNKFQHNSGRLIHLIIVVVVMM